MSDRLPNLILRDIRFAYRPNFAGRASQYNNAGDRNFVIRFDDEQEAMALLNEGWNIKEKVEQETEDIFWTLEVAVSFKNYPPKIKKVGEITLDETVLDERTVELLDNLRLTQVNVSLSPYSWSVQGNTGVKAYLAELIAWVEESALDLELRDEIARRKGNVVAGDPIFGD